MASSSSSDQGKVWEQVLSKKLVRHVGGDDEVETVDVAEALKGKHVGLYFSAHWCAPTGLVQHAYAIPCRQHAPAEQQRRVGSRCAL